jgi:hypothetical protein
MELIGALGAGAGGVLLLEFFGLVGTAGASSAVGGVFAGLIGLGLSASAAVVILVGAFLTIIAGGFTAWQYFGALGAALAAQKDILRCQLYNSANAQEAQQVLIDATNTAVAGIIGEDIEQDGLFGDILETIVDTLLPEEIPALLFKAGREFIRGEVVYDCADCVQSPGAVAYGVRIHVVTFSSDHSNTDLALMGFGTNTQGYNSVGALLTRTQLDAGDRQMYYHGATYTPPVYDFNLQGFREEYVNHSLTLEIDNDNLSGGKTYAVEVDVWRILETSPGVYEEVLWTDAQILADGTDGVTFVNGRLTYLGNIPPGTRQVVLGYPS